VATGMILMIAVSQGSDPLKTLSAKVHISCSTKEDEHRISWLFRD